MNPHPPKKIVIISIFAVAFILFAIVNIMSSHQTALTLMPTARPTPDVGVEIGSQIKEPTTDVPETNPFTTAQPNPFSNYENPFE